MKTAGQLVDTAVMGALVQGAKLAHWVLNLIPSGAEKRAQAVEQLATVTVKPEARTYTIADVHNMRWRPAQSHSALYPSGQPTDDYARTEEYGEHPDIDPQAVIGKRPDWSGIGVPASDTDAGRPKTSELLSAAIPFIEAVRFHCQNDPICGRWKASDLVIELQRRAAVFNRVLD